MDIIPMMHLPTDMMISQKTFLMKCVDDDLLWSKDMKGSYFAFGLRTLGLRALGLRDLGLRDLGLRAFGLWA